MKSSLLHFVLFALVTALPLRATEDAQIAALSALDDARVAAMKMPDHEKLAAVFSDELHYAHSNGLIDTKASFIDALVGGRTKYLSYNTEERKFTFPASGIALMTGRTRILVANPTGNVEATLSYLAVWREEKGVWRFLAWQSCRLPPPTPVAK